MSLMNRFGNVDQTLPVINPINNEIKLFTIEIESLIKKFTLTLPEISELELYVQQSIACSFSEIRLHKQVTLRKSGRLNES